MPLLRHDSMIRYPIYPGFFGKSLGGKKNKLDRIYKINMIIL
ncbi:hypothetical protein ACFL50_05920 [Candidatus Latescibacterota bacterium]